MVQQQVQCLEPEQAAEFARKRLFICLVGYLDPNMGPTEGSWLELDSLGSALARAFAMHDERTAGGRRSSPYVHTQVIGVCPSNNDAFYQCGCRLNNLNDVRGSANELRAKSSAITPFIVCSAPPNTAVSHSARHGSIWCFSTGSRPYNCTMLPPSRSIHLQTSPDTLAPTLSAFRFL